VKPVGLHPDQAAADAAAFSGDPLEDSGINHVKTGWKA
jgi:hypothetical protein